MKDKQAHSFHTHVGQRAAQTLQDNHNASEPNAVSQAAATNKQSTSTSGLNFDLSASEAEIRRDYIYDEYAIIAPKRHDRPFDFRGNDHPLIETASSPHLNDQTVIDELASPLGGWPVRVVENKFPAITLKTPKAYGQQELVVDTPLSNLPPGHLSLESMQDVLTMYQQRIKKLSKVDHVKYVQVFKNDGHHAGASLAHAHTQIFALPIVPPKYQQRAELVDAYIEHKQSDPYNDIIQFELKQKQRVIDENTAALSFAPYASGWPLEAWIMPKQHKQSFSDCSKQEIKQIAQSLLILLRKLNDAGVNYNFFIEEGVSPSQRWVLKVYGREVVSPLGGLEVSTGIMINTIPPEVAAAWYKAS